MKKYLRIGAMCLIILALGASLMAMNSVGKERRADKTCTELEITFADNYNFVTEEDVKGYLEKYYANWNKVKADSLDLAKVERILDEKSAILKSEAYVTDDGVLNIRITQREPVIRFQKRTSGFYVDKTGFIFPLQKNFTSRVPVIDGEIPIFYSSGYKGELQSQEEKEWMDRTMDLVLYMNRHKQWSGNIVQISVASNGDFLLVPREGNEIFNFGDATDIEKKFSRIEKYYQYVKPLGKDYSSVCVKYDRQIICK